MESCGDCLRLENRLRAASEYYVSLIVEHDQMIRVGDSEVGVVEDLMRKARRRRNAAARLLLAHRASHEDSRPKTATARLA